MKCPTCGGNIEVRTRVWVFFATKEDGSIDWVRREVDWDSLDDAEFGGVCVECGNTFDIRNEKVVAEAGEDGEDREQQ
jgi:DNA-directed RNA polymerase subunit RPC12/RpoP